MRFGKDKDVVTHDSSLPQGCELHNHRKYDIFCSCIEKDSMSILKKGKWRYLIEPFAAVLKEYKTESSPLTREGGLLHIAFISEYKPALLREVYADVMCTQKKMFLPIFNEKGLEQFKLAASGGDAQAQQIIDHWKRVSAPFWPPRWLEQKVCNNQRKVTLMLVEEGSHVFREHFKIHHYQCTHLVQKMLSVQDLLHHITDLYCNYYPCFSHIVRVLERGKVLLQHCTSRYWLLTGLFKSEAEKEFEEIIIELDDYCLLMIDLLFAQFSYVNKHLKKFRELFEPVNNSLSFCARKDKLQFLDDLAEYQPLAHESGLVQLLLSKEFIGSHHQRCGDEHPLLQSEEIETVSVLGAGTDGEVSEIKWKHVTLAMKKFEPESKEVGILAKLKHPNIITVVYSPAGNGRMFMECQKSFTNFVEKCQPSYALSLDIMLQIARAMCYLHDNDTIHRDLKPANLLINCDNPTCKNLHVKVAGFGIARSHFKTENTTTLGTLPYMAPEVFKEERYSKKADVFSYAKTCFYILTGKPPSTTSACPSDIPSSLWHYLNTCSDENAENRPSFAQICRVLKLLKKADVLAITPQVDEAYSDYSNGTMVDHKFRRCKIEIDIIKSAALAMLEHPSDSTTQHTVEELTGWLIVDKLKTPQLFKKISNPQLLDGTVIILKSVKLQKYLSVDGDLLRANKDLRSQAQEFKLWRHEKKGFFHIQGPGPRFRFLRTNGTDRPIFERGCISKEETLEITVSPKAKPNADTFQVHFKAQDDRRPLQVPMDGCAIESLSTKDEWSDNDPALYEMTIIASPPGGEFQLVNGYGKKKASRVLKKHWKSFVTENNFYEFARRQIRVVKILVGWWIINTPAPFVEGASNYLENAFDWARLYNMKIIISVQDSLEHRNGEYGLETSYGFDSRAKTLETITFLAKKYGNNPTLQKIESVPGIQNQYYYGIEYCPRDMVQIQETNGVLKLKEKVGETSIPTHSP